MLIREMDAKMPPSASSRSSDYYRETHNTIGCKLLKVHAELLVVSFQLAKCTGTVAVLEPKLPSTVRRCGTLLPRNPAPSISSGIPYSLES